MIFSVEAIGLHRLSVVPYAGNMRVGDRRSSGEMRTIIVEAADAFAATASVAALFYPDNGTAAADDFIVKMMNLNAAQHRIIMDCVATQSCSPFAMRYFETEMRLKYGDDWRAHLDKELGR